MLLKFKSFSTRLSLCIIAVVGLLFVVSFAIYFNFAKKAITNEAFQTSQSQLSLVTKSIDAILESVELSVNNASLFVLQSIDDPSTFQNILANMISSNPSIYGGCVAFEPNYYDKYGGYFMLYGAKIRLICRQLILSKFKKMNINTSIRIGIKPLNNSIKIIGVSLILTRV